MSRLIGAILMTVSALAVGFVMRGNARRRIGLIRLSVSLLAHAKRKIDLFGTPAEELFSDFSGVTDRNLVCVESTEQLLAQLAENIVPFGEPLCRFAREIGTGYKEDALRLCDLCIAQMSESLHLAEESFRVRKKLYIVLPFLLAVSVIILLL